MALLKLQLLRRISSSLRWPSPVFPSWSSLSPCMSRTSYRALSRAHPFPVAWRQSGTAGKRRRLPRVPASSPPARPGTGFAAAKAARAGGSSVAGAALRGMGAGFSSGAQAAGSAAKEKAIGSPGAYSGSILGLANGKARSTSVAVTADQNLLPNATTNHNRNERRTNGCKSRPGKPVPCRSPGME